MKRADIADAAVSQGAKQAVGAVVVNGVFSVYLIDPNGNLLCWNGNIGAGTWSGLGNPSAAAIVGPIGVSVVGTTPNVFVIDDNYALWCYADQWCSLGGPGVTIANAVGVCTLNGVTYCYVLGVDGNLYCCYTDETSWLWSPPIAPLTNVTLEVPIGVTVSGDGSLVMAYLTGIDQHLYSNGSSQWSWTDNGATPSPVENGGLNTGVLTASGAVNTVVLCEDNCLWCNVDGAWQTVGQPSGFPLTQCVGAAIDNNQNLNCYAVDSAGSLWCQGGVGSGGWINVVSGPVPFVGGVGVTSSSNEIDVFLMGNDGNVYDCTYSFANSTWTSAMVTPA